MAILQASETPEATHPFLDLPRESQEAILNANLKISQALSSLVSNTRTDAMNTVGDPDTDKSLMMARIDAPGGFGHPPEGAGISIISESSKEVWWSKTNPQCMEDPKLPWNWHYNTLGTLQLEKYLQTKYTAENIRIDNPEDLYKDMEEHPENYESSVGVCNADDGVVWNRDCSYFRASGGVDYVWRHHASGHMYVGDAHPANGVSVRLRRG